MVGADVADEGVGAGDDDASAYSEEKEQEEDAAVAGRARQSKERDGDEGKAEHESDLFALGVEQRADADGGDDEPEGLDEGDGSVLAGGEAEAVGEVGQDGAQHGGDHSIDEDRDDGCKDQHAKGSFRWP